MTVTTTTRSSTPWSDEELRVKIGQVWPTFAIVRKLLQVILLRAHPPHSWSEPTVSGRITRRHQREYFLNAVILGFKLCSVFTSNHADEDGVAFHCRISRPCTQRRYQNVDYNLQSWSRDFVPTECGNWKATFRSYGLSARYRQGRGPYPRPLHSYRPRKWTRHTDQGTCRSSEYVFP
jgi:hypothetical protein